MSFPATTEGALWEAFLSHNPSTDLLASMLDRCQSGFGCRVSIEISKRKDAGIIHAISVLSSKHSHQDARNWAAKHILDNSSDPDHLTHALQAYSPELTAQAGRALLKSKDLSAQQLTSIMEEQVREYHQDVVDEAAQRVLELPEPSPCALASVVVYASDGLKTKAVATLGRIGMETIEELLMAEDASKAGQ